MNEAACRKFWIVLPFSRVSTVATGRPFTTFSSLNRHSYAKICTCDGEQVCRERCRRKVRREAEEVVEVRYLEGAEGSISATLQTHYCTPALSTYLRLEPVEIIIFHSYRPVWNWPTRSVAQGAVEGRCGGKVRRGLKREVQRGAAERGCRGE